MRIDFQVALASLTINTLLVFRKSRPTAAPLVLFCANLAVGVSGSILLGSPAIVSDVLAGLYLPLGVKKFRDWYRH